MVFISKRLGRSLFYSLILFVTSFSTGVASKLAMADGFFGDIQPPTVHIIQPQDGAVVKRDSLLIQVVFFDTGSGVDISTICVSLDQNNITTQAVTQSNLTAQNVKMESAANPYKLDYKPVMPLTPDMHELSFAVRDKNGNLAEAHSRFQVLDSGVSQPIGLTNTLVQDFEPDKKMTDNLDLGFQVNVAKSSLRAETTAKISNYPTGVTPLFREGDSRFFLQKYFLDWRSGGFDLTWGDTVTALESELFQVGRDIQGTVVSNAAVTPYGNNNWGLFSGQATTSRGIGLRVYEISGLTEHWVTKSGQEWSAMYIKMDGVDSYDVLNLTGRSNLGKDTVIKWEVIHGISKEDMSLSDGLIGHFDSQVSWFHFGIDLVNLWPGYSLPELPSQYSLSRYETDDGLRSYGVRTAFPFFTQGILSLTGAYTHDNLNGSHSGTTHRTNLNATYDWFPVPGLHLDCTYQGEMEEQQGPEPFTSAGNNFVITLGKQWTASAAELSFSRESCYKAWNNELTVNEHLLGSWTKPLGVFRIIPSVEWKKGWTGINDVNCEERWTVEADLFPDLPASEFTVFHRNSDAGYSGKYSNGFELRLYLWLWKNSWFSLKIQNEWWMNPNVVPSYGRDVAYHLEWVCKL